MSLEDGIKALQQQQYAEAIQFLEDYCQHPLHKNTPAYIQAQIALARAYRGNNQRDKAFALSHVLQNHPERQISEWASGFISILVAEEKAGNLATGAGAITNEEKPLRTFEPEVRLPLPKAKFYLNLACCLTYTLIVAIVSALCFAFTALFEEKNFSRFIIAFGITFILHFVVFFISPLIMDLIQKWLYNIQWLNLAQIRKYSPEAVTVISRVCRKKKLHTPRLGIIDDGNPIAFTYGVFPNKARIVVTKKLLESLKDEEIATVYAHELGHTLQWNFSLMTVGTTFIQTVYLCYLFFKNLSQGSRKFKQFFRVFSFIAIVPYLVYLLSNYLMFYLSRNREYFADHFAAEATGNPNGLSRALIKIAYVFLEEQKQATQSSSLIAMTRILTIYDAQTALIPGMAYRLISNFNQIGLIFLWDLFNPWAIWLGLNSPHPLPGKRIYALMNYAQLLGLENQFNMISVIVQGNQLDQGKLYGNFILELLIFNAQWIGMIGGIILSFFLRNYVETGMGIMALAVVGFGVGMLLKIWRLYPKLNNVLNRDIFSLMCDPYASPLRGCPVQQQGRLIGQAEFCYELGSDLLLQEPSRIVFARYSSPFGTLGNLGLGGATISRLMGSDVSMVGWFRRGLSAWIDWSQVTNSTVSLRNYPGLWLVIRGGGVILLGLIMLIYALGTHR